MFAFVVYAIAVWYAAARWRRQWESFAFVGLGLAGLLLVAYLHYLLNVWTEGRIFLPILRSLLYPYTAVVVAVGLYLACLPTGVRILACPGCDYDLRGLEEEINMCPECGTPFMISGGIARKVYAEPICLAAPRPAPTRAKRDTQRRRPGPPPVVLRWPPVSAAAE